MNKKLIIPGALVAMAALIGVAMIADCVRLANDARYRVQLADQELAKHEQRLVKTLKGFSDRTSEVDAGIERYELVTKMPERHEAYEKVVASFQSTMASAIDATNPINRKFMDDVAGAINRRQIAEKQLDEEWRAYEEFMNSRRGRVASAFTDRIP